MTQQVLRVVDPWTYTIAILDGAVADIREIPDYEPMDATRLDHLKLAFLFPEWQQGLWQGLRKSGPGPRAQAMTRIGEYGHMDMDGVEYLAAASVVAEDRFGKPYVKSLPWRRVTPKRETSSQIRNARWLEPNA